MPLGTKPLPEQCWPNSITPYDTNRPELVNSWHAEIKFECIIGSLNLALQKSHIVNRTSDSSVLCWFFFFFFSKVMAFSNAIFPIKHVYDACQEHFLRFLGTQGHLGNPQMPNPNWLILHHECATTFWWPPVQTYQNYIRYLTTNIMNISNLYLQI